MKTNLLLKRIIWALAIGPFLLGSLIFFYWYIQRTSRAVSVDIEFPGLLAILLFLVSVVVSIFLYSINILKKRITWKEVIIPFIFLLFTVPFIQLYGILHDELSKKAYIRIKNDTNNCEIIRFGSKHFEYTYFRDRGNDFVLSFHPVYTYYEKENSSLDYYEIADVSIDLKEESGAINRYVLPKFQKGRCETIVISEIIAGNYDSKRVN
ncbi:MAG: hypothetical protein NXI20_01775 [bacterium]|nr:hypothetical protein [bacterium]